MRCHRNLRLILATSNLGSVALRSDTSYDEDDAATREQLTAGARELQPTVIQEGKVTAKPLANHNIECMANLMARRAVRQLVVITPAAGSSSLLPKSL